jgi:thiol-disulfide isomerase/thioredoxin
MSEIEEIKAEIARLQARLLELEPLQNKGTIEAVAATNSIVKAAENLDMSKADVQKFLSASEVPHLYGESWCVACRRYLAGEKPQDNYTYPKEWIEKAEKISELVSKYGFKTTGDKLLLIGKEKGYFPEKTKTIANVLGRFLQVNGYDTKGEFRGLPEWI